MRKSIYKYQNYSQVVSNTIPGRCYSIKELLARVMRGEPLPMVPPQYEEQAEMTEDQIDAQMERFESHPMFDRASDIIEAKNAVEMINEKEKASRKKSKK